MDDHRAVVHQHPAVPLRPLDGARFLPVRDPAHPLHLLHDRRQLPTVGRAEGIGKSFALATEAIFQRPDLKKRVVYINNPSLILTYPELLFVELVYAFSRHGSSPSDIVDGKVQDINDSSSDTKALKMIYDAYVASMRLDFRDIVVVLEGLLKSLSKHCLNLRISFELLLDQYNALFPDSEGAFLDSDFLEFMKGKFFRSFGKVIAVSSATNSDLSRVQPSKCTVLQLFILPNDESIKLFCSEQFQAIDLGSAKEIVGFTGRNFLEIRRLMEGEGATVEEKCQSYVSSMPDRIKEIEKKHDAWLIDYNRIFPEGWRLYMEWLSYVDTGIEVPNWPDSDDGLVKHVDTRYFYYDEENCLLFSALPAVRRTSFVVLAKRLASLPDRLYAMLTSGPNDQIFRATLLEDMLHSVFWIHHGYRDPWVLTLPTPKNPKKVRPEGPIYVHPKTTFIHLGNLAASIRSSSAKVKAKDRWLPFLPYIRNFPVCDGILFDPTGQRFILLQAAVNPRDHKDSQDQFFNAAPATDGRPDERKGTVVG